MSQQEFENYLALLTRLLKVAPRQREQMAEEFRAHLEDRLDELLAGGMAKDKAVQQAIGEFGDAAVLAVELARVAQRRRRRFIMRMSYAGVGALALAGLLVFALWPEGRRVQGPQAAVAQVDAGGAAGAPEQPQENAIPDRVSQANKKIQAALDKDASFDFLDTPIADVAGYLSETYNIPVILCKGALADAAITVDVPVTSSLRGITLRSALRVMLEQHRMDFVVRDEVLQITTPEDAESQLITRVYDCRELLALPTPPGSSRPKAVAGGGGFFAVENEPVGKSSEPSGDGAGSSPATGGRPPPAADSAGTEGGGSGGGGVGDDTRRREMSDAENLMSLIANTVDPDSWDDNGGPGTIAEYKGLLAISQTGEIHDKVERLLNMLHASAGLKEKRVKVVE